MTRWRLFGSSQRGASRVYHYPEKITDKSRWQRLAQYVIGDVENKAGRVIAKRGNRKDRPYYTRIPVLTM